MVPRLSTVGVTCVCLLLMTRPSIARFNPAQDQAQPSGSAELVAIVIAADGAAPVRRARLTLSGAITRHAETDSTGRFDFTNLPAGTYRLLVEPTSGFAGLFDNRPVMLVEGRTLNLTVRVERTGVISGRIIDETGEPVLGVQVEALRWRPFDRQPAGPVAHATTDDLGQFRLFNLVAGDYYVVATYPRFRNDDAEAASRTWYASTYYPGSSSFRDARQIVVRRGQESPNVDFSLSTVPVARVVIVAVDSHGVPLSHHAQVSLIARGNPNVALGSRFANPRKEDGTFVFTDIAPGVYNVVVTTSPYKEEAAYVKVDVAGDDVTLKVQTNNGAKMSGRVVVKGSPSRSYAWPPRVGVSAYPVGSIWPTDMRLTELAGTDRFELTALRGPMRISADVANGALVSIRRDGTDITGKVVEFVGTETIDDVEITVTTDVAAADVAVVDGSRSEDARPVLVVLFAEDASLWHEGFLQYAHLPAFHLERETHVHLGRMVAGRYLIAAVQGLDVDHPTDSRVLETLRPFAVPVTLTSDQLASVRLSVVRVPE